MGEVAIQFEDFLREAHPADHAFINQIHTYLIDNGCRVSIKPAKNGYVVSYTYEKSKKVIMNFVFRKSGLVTRIYGNYINSYMDILDTLPEGMQKSIEKAPVCKRLLDPTACSSSCPMGYTFAMQGATYQKCRYNSFMFQVNHDNSPFISAFIEKELMARAACHSA